MASAAALIEEARTPAGLRAAAERLGDVQPGAPLLLDRAAMAAAFSSLPVAEQALLERVAGRVRAFASAQLASLAPLDMAVGGAGAGMRAGHSLAPVASAGCYAPGGRYPLPSSVIMTAVTARAAGVERVIVASPRPATVTIAAAYVAGADSLLAVGGAQAIGALSHGAGGLLAPCDVIVGPGNRWVTAAKKLVAGACAIDMLAGPSECCVLADGGADARLIAADLLAQAEHDSDAQAVLVTTSAALLASVEAELASQLSSLPTRATAAAALSRQGIAVVCTNLDEAIAVVDAMAPEHLEVQVADSDAAWRRVRHYGGAFIGGGSAEVFGDYGAGPNHVLPTAGTARYTGGLSVFTFLRVRTWLRADPAPPADPDGAAARRQIIEDSAHLARLEGLFGHEAAALARLTKE